MPTPAATRALPAAFEVIRQMHSQRLEWREACRAPKRRAPVHILEDRMTEVSFGISRR